MNTNQTAQQSYNEAKAVLDSGLYSRAIDLLKGMESRYPFGPMARQVQLDLIFAYNHDLKPQRYNLLEAAELNIQFVVFCRFRPHLSFQLQSREQKMNGILEILCHKTNCEWR